MAKAFYKDSLKIMIENVIQKTTLIVESWDKRKEPLDLYIDMLKVVCNGAFASCFGKDAIEPTINFDFGNGIVETMPISESASKLIPGLNLRYTKLYRLLFDIFDDMYIGK
jgi:hypothetical protein